MIVEAFIEGPSAEPEVAAKPSYPPAWWQQGRHAGYHNAGPVTEGAAVAEPIPQLLCDWRVDKVSGCARNSPIQALKPFLSGR
jgi:hypothetical protein